MRREKVMRQLAVVILAGSLLTGCAGTGKEETKKTTGTAEAVTETVADTGSTTEAETEAVTKAETETETETETEIETEAMIETETEEEDTVSLPDDLPQDFVFSSGVGAWQSELTLYPDGTFEGSYHDSDMGSTGDGYPGGTVYISQFSGTFTDIRKINDYTYAMTLSELNNEYTEGDEWIEDEVLYVASSPAGLDGGTEFRLYLPDTPTDMVSEEFLSWWPYAWQSDEYDTLSCYGICNEAMGYGFFSY